MIFNLIEKLLFGETNREGNKKKAENIVDSIIKKHQPLFEDLAKHDNKDSLEAIMSIHRIGGFKLDET